MDTLKECVVFDKYGSIDYEQTLYNIQCNLQMYIDDAKNAVKNEMKEDIRFKLHTLF